MFASMGKEVAGVSGGVDVEEGGGKTIVGSGEGVSSLNGKYELLPRLVVDCKQCSDLALFKQAVPTGETKVDML